MLDESAELPELQVLGPDARRAVSTARSEAQRLGHRRIGTEHLLLGILAETSSPASQMLTKAGAGRAAVWTKVREATSAASEAPLPDAPEEATPRAARALRRSVRFSHRRHTDEVTPEDLLAGVLDVEGTAGQVLRSIGVDMDDLRAELDGEPTASDGTSLSHPGVVRCPACAADLSAGLVCRTVTSHGDQGDRQVLVHSCPECGVGLGVTAA